MFKVIALTGSEGLCRFDEAGEEIYQTSSGVGKDTFADTLGGISPVFRHMKLATGLRKSFYDYWQLDKSRMGDKSYEMAKLVDIQFPFWTHQKEKTVNQLMCEYSAEVLAGNSLAWVDELVASFEPWTIPVISDLRQPHELMVLRAFFSTTVVDISRVEGEGLRERQPVDGLLAGLADYSVRNNRGPVKLKACARELAHINFYPPAPGSELVLAQSRLHYKTFRQNYKLAIQPN